MNLTTELNNPTIAMPPTLPRTRKERGIRNVAVSSTSHESLTKVSVLLDVPMNQMIEIGTLFFLKSLLNSNQLSAEEKVHLRLIVNRWESNPRIKDMPQVASKKRKSVS